MCAYYYEYGILAALCSGGTVIFGALGLTLPGITHAIRLITGTGGLSACFCCLLIFFKINFFEKFFQEYHQSVKQFESRSGLMFGRA